MVKFEGVEVLRMAVHVLLFISPHHLYDFADRPVAHVGNWCGGEGTIFYFPMEIHAMLTSQRLFHKREQKVLEKEIKTLRPGAVKCLF